MLLWIMNIFMWKVCKFSGLEEILRTYMRRLLPANLLWINLEHVSNWNFAFENKRCYKKPLIFLRILTEVWAEVSCFAKFALSLLWQELDIIGYWNCSFRGEWVVWELLSVTSPVAGWCCQARVTLFTVPIFPCLVSQCKHPLVRLACFNIDRVYLFPFKSSVEQQIQFPTLTITLGSCVCSLGKCLADVGVLGYSPVLDFWKHCSICMNVLVKVSVKVFN